MYMVAPVSASWGFPAARSIASQHAANFMKACREEDDALGRCSKRRNTPYGLWAPGQSSHTPCGCGV